jgi:hypothetical protein
VPFLSSKTLHIVDRIMWMLPFVTVSDLNAACKRADVSHETRNNFVQKMRDEHSAPGSRGQKALWSAWVRHYYAALAAAPVRSGGGRLSMEAKTPDDSEGEGGVSIMN